MTITPLGDDPAVGAELVALIRSVYDDAVAEPGLPVPAETLVLSALLRDPAAFARPTAALSELLDQLGPGHCGRTALHVMGLIDDGVSDAHTAREVPTLSRNQPCWCGSGRKFTACHLGRVALAPLPERVGWLCRKATAYLERRGGRPGDAVFEHAAARVVDPGDDDALHDALDDPLVIDVVLHEGGWFERFLAERGALLPEDEASLARAWTLVDRTIYEVVEVRPGAGVGVRDLRTGDVLDVRERTFSCAARRGGLVCARAVPDGESHQFIGGIFAVAPGTERALFDLLDDRDGHALLAYVAELHTSQPNLAADVGVLGHQVQSSASR